MKQYLKTILNFENFCKKKIKLKQFNLYYNFIFNKNLDCLNLFKKYLEMIDSIR